MQCVSGTNEIQKKSSMQSSDFVNQEQLNQQITNKTQGFNFNNQKITINQNQNDNIKGQKIFNTNINFQNQANCQFQGKAMTMNNQFQIVHLQNQIEQSNKEKESHIQDLMKISQKAVQRRKERVLEKYLQPNQNIIEDQLS